MKIKPNTINYDSPIVFDLETSSADIASCQIIQISALHAETGEEFNRYVQFDVTTANPQALEINSYDEELWKKKAVEPYQAMGDFVKFCHQFKNLPRESKKGSKWRSVMLMGYNSSKFDMPIIDRTGRECFKKFFAPWDFRGFDVLQWAMLVFPGYSSYKLESMAALCDCYDANAHDAVADCRMTLGIARACLAELYDEESLPKWAQEE